MHVRLTAGRKLYGSRDALQSLYYLSDKIKRGFSSAVSSYVCHACASSRETTRQSSANIRVTRALSAYVCVWCVVYVCACVCVLCVCDVCMCPGGSCVKFRYCTLFGPL